MVTAAMASAGKRSWPAYRWEACHPEQGISRISKGSKGESSRSNGTWVLRKQQLEACSQPRLHTRLRLLTLTLSVFWDQPWQVMLHPGEVFCLNRLP